MARYTAEFLAAVQHAYEDTDEPMRAVARRFEIGITTLSTLAEKNHWRKRSERLRGSPTAPLVGEAEALMASLPPRGEQAIAPATPMVPLSAASGPAATATPAARLEDLVLKEIAAEEAARAELGDLPRLRAEADGCVRRLAILAQTLQTVQKLRDVENGKPQRSVYEDDMPEDIDAFRTELARRIRVFFEIRRKDAQEASETAAAGGQDTSAV